MATDRFAVSLGQGGEGQLSLSKEARDVHLHVVGLSRQGKSYFLEHLIRQDIEQGAGVCVIDPHGEMYENLVRWLAEKEMHKRRRIHLINPAMGQWSVGFNPLCLDDPYIDARVGAMIDACQKVWEDSESAGHKTLAKLLQLTFETLARKQLSLREAPLLTSLAYKETRQRLVEEIGDPELADGWAEMDGLTKSDFVNRFEAVSNRLRALTRAPGIASMIGQTEDVIDFKTCMEHGHVVLVNLLSKGRIPPSVSTTLGALITADLFHTAQTRDVDTAKERPFYCYIDECGEYLNETIIKGLDQTAKFGLHYILSHQGLDQLGKDKDVPARRGVMRGAQSKVVFLQDDKDSTSELAELLFGKSFDLEEPKKVLIKPAVVGFSREWLQAEGYAKGISQTEGSGINAGTSIGVSLSEMDGAMPVHIESDTSGLSSFSGSSESYVESNSQHEAMVPILQDLPGGVYSLDDLKHRAGVQIRLLQKRQAFAYRADDREARQFATADVVPARPTVDQIKDFYSTVRGREPSSKLVKDVEQAVAERRVKLLEQDPAQPLESTDDFF